MHGDAEALVGALIGVIASHILYGPRPEKPGAVESAQVQQHLVKRHQIDSRSNPPPPGIPARAWAGVLRSVSSSCPASVRA